MIEIWKEIPSYPYCEASNLGRIKYKDSYKLHHFDNQIRPLKLTGFGYYQITIKGKTLSVHNLILETFIGFKPDNGYRADHINGNKLDNRIENLRWIPHGTNTKRAKYTGNRIYFYAGELWLIKKLITLKVPYLVLSKMFKCSTMVIQDVKKGLKDTHLKNCNNCIPM